MSRLATPAEVLAVARSGGREVTLEELGEAIATSCIGRWSTVEVDDLKDWREQQWEGELL